MMRWHCAYTAPRAEKWARSNLWERGFDVYLPLYARRRRHARRTDVVEAPLFPRYLFVRADFATHSARSVATAPGVESLVRFGGVPGRVPAAVIAELRAHENRDGLIDIDFGRGAASRYRRGERVRIEEGALCNSVGLFQCREDDRRVVILMELLGRFVRVRVPAAALARAE